MKNSSRSTRKSKGGQTESGTSCSSNPGNSLTKILLTTLIFTFIIILFQYYGPLSEEFIISKGITDLTKIKPLEDILKEALQEEGGHNIIPAPSVSADKKLKQTANSDIGASRDVSHKPKPVITVSSVPPPSKSSSVRSSTITQAPKEVPVVEASKRVRYDDVRETAVKPMSWDDFVRLKPPHIHPVLTSKTKKAAPISAAVSTLIQCASTVVDSLASPVLNKDDFTWCKWALSPSGGQVRVGKSWGKLEKDKSGKERFDDLNCNAVSVGRNPSCDDEWGDPHITNWAKRLVSDVKCGSDRTSRVRCYDNNNKDRFCVLENAMIDFRKYRDIDRGTDRTKSRKFDKGFISTDCDTSQGEYFPFKHLYSSSLQSRQCDRVVNGTALMFSHDDFSNIGHTMNDFQNVWMMMWLDNRGRYFNETPFLNIDALKLGHSYQDEIGKFHTIYQRDFPSPLLRGHDYKGSAVCFQRLLVQPVPPKFFVWGSWFKDSTCSLRGPSSLHQRWNLHLRHSFGQLPDSLNFKAISMRNVIKILFIVRNVHKNLWGSNRSSRNILNMDEVRDKLTSETVIWNKAHASSGVKIDMVFQDLAQLTIPQQIELAASSSIIAGTHGAGIVLSNFMPIGRENCCGVFEIYPQGEFTPIRGHGNMARKTGLHYDRMDIGTTHSRSEGCTVDAGSLWLSLAKMVAAMRTKPSCVLPAVINDPFMELNRN